MMFLSRRPEPLSNQFQNELGDLVDRYLIDGLSSNDIKYVLRCEADYDYEERRRELLEAKAKEVT